VQCWIDDQTLIRRTSAVHVRATKKHGSVCPCGRRGARQLADSVEAISMRRCVIALRPFTLPTAGLILRRAGLSWRALLSRLSGPYRPERHYMRGPGPKYHERQDRECIDGPRFMTDSTIGVLATEETGQGKGEPHKYCPRCRALIVLARVAPKFGPLPELRTYKCLQCGRVIEEDIGQ
jgi:hypothetical protein